MPGSHNTFSPTGNEPFTIFYSTTNTTGPMFDQTGGVGTHYSNFVLSGPNTISQYQFPNEQAACYVMPGMRDSQYSPLCGFSFDAFVPQSGTVALPPDGGYPGLSSCYNTSNKPSTNCLLENVSVCNFVVGFGITMSGAGSLTDSMTFRRCNATICKVAYAAGQAQSKIHVIEGGNWGSVQTIFDGATYGSQFGLPPIEIHHIGIGFYHRVFNFSSTVGPCSMHHFYSESGRSLGNFGTSGTTSRQLLSLDNCPFTFYEGGAGGAPPGLPLPPTILECYGPAWITNCSFGVNNGNIWSWNFVIGTGAGESVFFPLVFNNSAFKAPPTQQLIPFVGLTSTQCVATLRDCYSSGTFPALPMSDISSHDISEFTWNGRAVFSVQGSLYANGTGNVFVNTANKAGSVTLTVSALTLTTIAVTFAAAPASGAVSAPLSTNWPGPSGRFPVTFSTGDVRNAIFTNGTTTCFWASAGQSSYGLTAAATTSGTVANTGLTFTYAGATGTIQVNDNLFWQMILQGGSTNKQTVLAWLVTAVSGTTITATPMFDATQYDTVANNPANVITIAQQQWAPSGASITCTTSTSSTTITALSSTQAPLNGDWVQGISGTTSVLPANTRVVSGAGTTSLVLNNTPTVAATGVDLYFARLQSPTVTATW